MGLFSFFRTKPAADVFWMTPRAKLAGFCNQVQERLNGCVREVERHPYYRSVFFGNRLRT